MAAKLAAGIAVLLIFPATAGSTEILEIKAKHVVYYLSRDGKAAGRIAKDKIELPLRIKDESTNGRFLVTIGGEDLWIPKLLTKTDEGAPNVAAKCQNITESHATSRGFGDCN